MPLFEKEDNANHRNPFVGEKKMASHYTTKGFFVMPIFWHSTVWLGMVEK